MAWVVFKENEQFKQHKEPRIKNVGFTVHKFNCRIKPTKPDRIKIISCFSEFGCETLGPLYCIPRLLKKNPGKYVIAMGWHGREYLYRHLVDEYWEIDEEHMWLREYVRAFHHDSVNLSQIEKMAGRYGDVVPSQMLGQYAICNRCQTCGHFWTEWKQQAEKCPRCTSTVLLRSIFTDIAKNKATARRIPRPRPHVMEWAASILKPNSVGLFARGRKTYGRNLTPEFYVELISMLESKGYNIIWLGEKQSVQPCPVDHVFDFSRAPEARDLEKTLAIISQLQFTVQFWTASTRLAGMMGVPFLLFESPEQIYATHSGLMPAQEGKRLELTTFGNKKIVLSHYKSIAENPSAGLALADQAIEEMRVDNWNEIVGLVEDIDFLQSLKKEHLAMLT